jgi:Fe-S cluster assembly protein SufD
METIINTTKLDAFRSHLTPTAINLPSAIVQEVNAVLDQTDFPTTRQEAWKYTRVGKIAAISAQQGFTPSDVKSFPIIDQEAYTIHVVNGQPIWTTAQDKLPQGVHIKTLSSCNEGELEQLFEKKIKGIDVFQALNIAYLTDGLMITVDENVSIDHPIQLLHLNTTDSQVSNVSHFISAHKGSKASFIIGSLSSANSNSFTNSSLNVHVAENATLTIDKLQVEEEGNLIVSNELVTQENGSTFTINTITLNGSLVRNNLTIEVDGTNCTTNLNGAYLLKGNQHVDNHTVVDHKQPHCNSNELYKGVMDDQSTGVFNGKVFVREDAQKINAFQSNGNVLLSDSATINSKPELEIYADDVKCSHGSTTGQLDEEAVFYLRARGLSEASARQLLVSAFISDVLDKIENDAVGTFIDDVLSNRFGWQR